MRLSLRAGLWLLPLFAPVAAPAVIIELMIERIQASEFVFSRADSHVPFVQAGWVETRRLGETSVSPGNLRYEETMFSEAVLSPVWIGRRDLVLAGEYVAFQQIHFRSPQVTRRNVTTFMPMATWVHQASPLTQCGVFLAPEFTRGSSYAGRSFEEANVTTGALAIHWTSDRWAWTYGGIALLAEDDNRLLPYLGALWQPRADVSVALILPWPTVSYAPRKDFMIQCGLGSTSATLAAIDDGQKLRVGYDSFDLLFSVHHQVSKLFWISAGAGWNGAGNFSITGSHNHLKLDLSGSPTWTVRLSLRPPKLPARP